MLDHHTTVVVDPYCDDAAYLACDNLIHSIADAANSHQSSIEGAMRDGSVAIQVTHNSWVIRNAGAEVLNGPHVAPVMHSQYVCHAAPSGGGVPQQLGEVAAAQDPRSCTASHSSVKTRVETRVKTRAVLCCAVLCCAVLCCAVIRSSMLCPVNNRNVLCCAVLCRGCAEAVLCHKRGCTVPLPL